MDIRAGLTISSTDQAYFVYIGLKFSRDSLLSSLENFSHYIYFEIYLLVLSFVIVISGYHNIPLEI